MEKVIKRIKIIDLTSWLSFLLFIGGIIFIALWVFFDFQQPDTTDSQLNLIKMAVLVLGGVFLGLALISAIVVSIFLLTTDWGNNEIKKKTKIFAILNIIPFLISIPSMLITKKLVNQFIKGKGQSVKSNKTTVSYNSNPQSSNSTQTQSPINNNQVTNSNNVQIVRTSTTSYPVNEPFWYINKWMYYDGKTYYEANENNEWVISNTILR